MISINEINNQSEKEFNNIFKNIIEHFPVICDYLISKRPFVNIENIEEHIDGFLEQLDNQTKETILKLHPDLAGRLSEEGKLTEESSKEQKHAGLDSITIQEKQLINQLNSKYKNKNGFPFVICARENKVKQIISGLKNRLENKKENEINIGINEVKKICKLRTRDLIGFN